MRVGLQNNKPFSGTESWLRMHFRRATSGRIRWFCVGTYFKVRADDGNLYILRRETSAPDGPWHLVSFRQLPRS